MFGTLSVERDCDCPTVEDVVAGMSLLGFPFTEVSKAT